MDAGGRETGSGLSAPLRTRLAVRLCLLALVVATIGCDRITKRLAVAELRGAPDRSYLGGVVRLTYVENQGAFLSLGSGLSAPVRFWLLTAGPAAGLVILLWAARRMRHDYGGLLALGLVAAGGSSNLWDRVHDGAVVDFLNVGFGGLRTGIFNVADAAITAGVLLMIVVSRGERGPREGPAPGDARPPTGAPSAPSSRP